MGWNYLSIPKLQRSRWRLGLVGYKQLLPKCPGDMTRVFLVLQCHQLKGTYLAEGGRWLAHICRTKNHQMSSADSAILFRPQCVNYTCELSKWMFVIPHFLWLLSFYVLNFQRKYKHVFTFYVIPAHWHTIDDWNPSSLTGLTYFTQSISWLLMSWRVKEPGHQQPWYWPSSTEITRSPHVKG